MPSNTLLPTPEPENKPMRCPRPMVSKALIARMPEGSSITNVSSLAASAYLENAATTAGLLETGSVAEGLQWCADHPEALADGGYRQSKEAIILYGMRRTADLGARGIRINCSAPGVTETPILDQLRSAYGQQYLDSFTAPLGRVSTAEEQAAMLIFLGSRAAGCDGYLSKPFSPSRLLRMVRGFLGDEPPHA